MARPLGASVRGFAAATFALLLDVPLQRRIAELERSPRVDRRYVDELRVAFAELQQAGEEWQAWRHSISVDGSVSEVLAEIGSGSAQHEEITPEEAAGMLTVTASRVRQLLRDKELEGRKVGRSWLVERAAVLAYRGTPRGDAA
jgi:excisionase family DNA binding protein